MLFIFLCCTVHLGVANGIAVDLLSKVKLFVNTDIFVERRACVWQISRFYI